MMSGHDIIVVGASAGGVEALMKLVRDLPGNLPAAVFVVLHIPAESRSLLPEILSHASPLPASHPENGAKIESGHIYVAPPDQHLLIEKGVIRVTRGPRENRHRPAIDPLFRSAALAYGPRVVGVILTGGLDDGTAGLLAIKRQRGIAIVQDPQDALYPSMPQSALTHVQVDYSLPLAAIGALLTRLAFETVEDEMTQLVPLELEKEVRNAAMETNALNDGEQIGKPSAFSCPECGGVLWEQEDGSLLRFRCRVGHAFSSESALAEQAEVLEKSLWVALKTLDEKVSLSRRMAEQARTNGREWLVRRFEAQLQEAEQHAMQLRKILTSNLYHGGMNASSQKTDKRRDA
ncbi:MAG TPA: chemotaxis protein CheB [Ktedonobacteraceae bacterium]|nr:chemotaxis protein CheB [Ktedonobacteraceae bacterium]